MCDVTCRDNSALMFVDPLTGLIVIVDGNSTGMTEKIRCCCLACAKRGTRRALPILIRKPATFVYVDTTEHACRTNAMATPAYLVGS